MELDIVNSNGYQGSSAIVSKKAVSQTGNESVENITVIPTEVEGFQFEDKVGHINGMTNSDIKKSIGEINSKLNKNTEAVFGIHDETNRITIKIVDKDSKEVIKEFPPEQTLEMIAKVWELAGLLVDEKL